MKSFIFFIFEMSDPAIEEKSYKFPLKISNPSASPGTNDSNNESTLPKDIEEIQDSDLMDVVADENQHSESSDDSQFEPVIDPALLHHEFGVPEEDLRTRDIRENGGVRVLMAAFDDEIDEDDVVEIAELLSNLGEFCSKLSWIEPKRIRLNNSRYQSQIKRAEYRKKYQSRPEVQERRAKLKADPAQREKKKAYNANPKTKERKKRSQKAKTLIYKAVTRHIPNLAALLEKDPQELTKILQSKGILAGDIGN